jgi:hypothetical protein
MDNINQVSVFITSSRKASPVHFHRVDFSVQYTIFLGIHTGLHQTERRVVLEGEQR